MTRPVGTVRAALVLLGALAVGSCSSSEPVAVFEPVTDPAKLFMSLTLDHRAVNLSTATSPTLQLTATPRNAFGEPMTGLPAPTFRSSDTTAVQVSADGLVTARREATGVSVIAEIVAPGNVRWTDVAMVNVTSSAPPGVASFSVDAGANGDVWPMRLGLNLSGFIVNEFFLGRPGVTLRSHALDATGTEIPGLVVEYESLDSAVAVVTRWDGGVLVLRPGSVRMVARTTAYGITQTVTDTFTVTLPNAIDIVIDRTLNGTVAAGPGPNAFTGGVAREYRIAPNGYVFWSNLVNEPVDLKFEDPVNVAAISPEVCGITNFFLSILGAAAPVQCGAGDILLPPVPTTDCTNPYCAPNTVQARQFPVPGVYRFSSTTGVTGQIVVSDEGAASATGP